VYALKNLATAKLNEARDETWGVIVSDFPLIYYRAKQSTRTSDYPEEETGRGSAWNSGNVFDLNINPLERKARCYVAVTKLPSPSVSIAPRSRHSHRALSRASVSCASLEERRERHDVSPYETRETTRRQQSEIPREAALFASSEALAMISSVAERMTRTCPALGVYGNEYRDARLHFTTRATNAGVYNAGTRAISIKDSVVRQ